MTSRFRPYLALLTLAIVLGLNFGVEALSRNSQAATKAAAQRPKPKDSYTGVSHFLMMDDPPKFNTAVSAFIAGKKLFN